MVIRRDAGLVLRGTNQSYAQIVATRIALVGALQH